MLPKKVYTKADCFNIDSYLFVWIIYMYRCDCTLLCSNRVLLGVTWLSYRRVSFEIYWTDSKPRPLTDNTNIPAVLSAKPFRIIYTLIGLISIQFVWVLSCISFSLRAGYGIKCLLPNSYLGSWKMEAFLHFRWRCFKCFASKEFPINQGKRALKENRLSGTYIFKYAYVECSGI